MANILVADDDLDIRDLLEFRLAKDGHEVRVVSNGPAAIEEAFSHDFDLIILDFHMPGLTGAQVAQAIRLDPDYASVPIVLATASATQDEIDVALAAGVDFQVEKPIPMRPFMIHIDRLLAEGRPEPRAATTPVA